MKTILKYIKLFFVTLWKVIVWIFSLGNKKGWTEYKIGIWSAVAWGILSFLGIFFGFATFPIGYFQKIAFGLIGTSVILGVTWWALGSTLPKLKELLDPDSDKLEGLTLWQQVKVGLFFFGLRAGGALLLASLC